MDIMKFNTIRELINYAPNCIICGKECIIYVEGQASKRKWINIKTITKDNILISKNKKYTLEINIDNNRIAIGKELVTTMLEDVFYITKTCYTCSFYLIFGIIDKFINDFISYVPSLNLREISLVTTLPGNKQLYMNTQYYSNPDVGNSYISVDDKSLQTCIDIELASFTSKKQLFRRINTILTFH